MQNTLVVSCGSCCLFFEDYSRIWRRKENLLVFSCGFDYHLASPVLSLRVSADADQHFWCTLRTSAMSGENKNHLASPHILSCPCVSPDPGHGGFSSGWIARLTKKIRLRNSDGWRGVDFGIFIDFQLILLEMGVLVHPQLGLRFGAALPGAFFLRKTTHLLKKHAFEWFSNDFFMKKNLICY